MTADLLSQGYEVLLPVSSCSPFDLAVLCGPNCVKVQVKYAAKKNGCVEVKLGRAVILSKTVKRRRFEQGEIDVIAVYCPDTRECYYVRAEEVGAYARFRIDSAKIDCSNVRDAGLYRKFPA